MTSIYQRWLAKRLGLGLLWWGFKGVQEEIPSEGASTLRSAQWHLHQDNAPVHNFILVTDYLTKMGIKTVPHLPIVQTLLAVTFGYSPSSEAFVMRQDERGCNESHWLADTRGLPWGLAGVVGSVQQRHCSRRRLLRRGLEFHVCSINKSGHTKKVWKLI